MHKPILLVDFDGVIHSYSSGWQGADKIPDPPVLGAIEWLMNATNYFEVNIYSSRTNQPDGRDSMIDYIFNHALHKMGDVDKAKSFIYDLKFPTEKPAAFLTIDDRALTFTGNWEDFNPQELLKFRPWNKH